MTEPLAILKGNGVGKDRVVRGNHAKAIAKRWLSDYPNADGFVIVTADPFWFGKVGGLGGTFVRVPSLEVVNAIDCQPEHFPQKQKAHV